MNAKTDDPPTPIGEAPTLELLLYRDRVPLGFVREAGAILLVARERSARWPVEILRSGAATLLVGGELVHGATELLTDRSEKEGALALFRDKYGTERFARWYDRPARIVRVRTRPGTVPEAAGARYYDWIAAEFDNVAEEYDHHITGNRINRLLRDRSLAQLRTTFARAPSLIEVGCGSGMETLPLLTEGHEIFCVDISQRMLDVVREKARRAGVSERLRTRRMRASELVHLLPDLGSGAFDGGYSTYGAFNCEEDLRPIPPALHGLFRDEARFVTGVYNRWCLFELAGYGATGQFARMLGRRERPVPVGSSRFCVDIFAHSPGDFQRLFSPEFWVERLEGVPVVLPPSDLAVYAEKFSRHFDTLARWDRALGSWWPLRNLGDHFLMTLRRSGRAVSSGSGR
ncbi:MAG TPA: methyltransferase domain-containing protein [Thermoplasmata archaeon]|nr:methyltransferase domain-containing protein [Thermoplasmata archaeon]